MEKDFKKYIIFWLSQSFSQLGSSMTAYALVLWQFTMSQSALAVSLMTFCNYVPYVGLSLFAGPIVDRHSKKAVMVISDSCAALATVFVLMMSLKGGLKPVHIYIVNAVIGCANAFQTPASAAAIGRIVPKEKLANAGGMASFSQNLIMVAGPVLAAAIYGFDGLPAVIGFDIASFAVACCVLIGFIHIKEDRPEGVENTSVFKGCGQGYAFLKENRGLLIVIYTLMGMNFLSRLTYENVLSPMILARSGGNAAVLGVVMAVMGGAGILGGLIAAAGKAGKDSVRMIFWSAGISFLLGDIFMGLGRNGLAWCFAGAAASLPISFIMAGQNVILYSVIPEDVQGRVFATRNAIQYSLIPAGILLGGILADYVFEPFMSGSSAAAEILQKLVGTGLGSGMAVMFLCTGSIGCVFSFAAYFSRDIQDLRRKLAALDKEE